jgi:hypothetical protein
VGSANIIIIVAVIAASIVALLVLVVVIILICRKKKPNDKCESFCAFPDKKGIFVCSSRFDKN